MALSDFLERLFYSEESFSDFLSYFLGLSYFGKGAATAPNEKIVEILSRKDD